MLKEVPQMTMSSLETRFNNIEEKLSMSAESVEATNSVNASLTDVHSSYNNPSRSTVTKMSNENFESHHKELMIEVANEIDERQKRRKSLVIHNIEETHADQHSE